MAGKNGKWVVETMFALVGLLALASVLLKKDIVSRSEAKEAAEATEQ